MYRSASMNAAAAPAEAAAGALTAAVHIPSAPHAADPGGRRPASGKEPAPNQAPRRARILERPRPLPPVTTRVTTGSVFAAPQRSAANARGVPVQDACRSCRGWNETTRYLRRDARSLMVWRLSDCAWLKSSDAWKLAMGSSDNTSTTTSNMVPMMSSNSRNQKSE